MKNTIIVYDFETTSVDPWTCMPVQLAAIAINSATLEFKPNSQFNSIIQPSNITDIAEDNIEFHCKAKKCTKQELLKSWNSAPSLKSVMNNFVSYLSQYNYKNSKFTAPIAAGHNITRYDNIILERIRQQLNISENELFHPRDSLDLLNICFLWFENLSKPERYSLDYLREFFGMSQQSKDHAHDALQDCKDAGAILIKFLKLHRNTALKIKFEGAFNKQ